jgi:glutathione S-transferase
VLHEQTSQTWIDRCVAQVAGVLDALQADRAGRSTPFWFGDAIAHADIAVACVLRFAAEAHPALFDLARWPALAAHASRCEALPPFQAIAQRFIPPS